MNLKHQLTKQSGPNLVPRALFPGFGEKRPGDEVESGPVWELGTVLLFKRY